MATYCNCNALNIDESKDRQIDEWTESGSEADRDRKISRKGERVSEGGGGEGASGKTRY